jgi:hypothetical protein
MIEDRIGEVRLRLRTDLPDAEELRPVAERMAFKALERCAALLEERLPGRVVVVSRLPLRWQLDETMLEDETLLDDLARAATDWIEAEAIVAPVDSSSMDYVALIFDDEPHFQAVQLLAMARGQSGRFHVAFDAAADPFAPLIASGRRANTEAILLRLAREGALAEVIAAWPANAVAMVAAALGVGASPLEVPTTSLGADDRVEAPGIDKASLAELEDLASGWPALSGHGRAIALRAHASVLLSASMDAPEAIALAGLGAAHVKQSPIFGIGAGEAPGSDVTAPIRFEQEEAAARPPQIDASAADEVVITGCAGLLYLLDRVQELDLAEALWKACLPEGAVLASAATSLLGPSFAGDPAPALFGGVDGDISCPEVDVEQLAEVASSVCAALGEALPRRSLAELPVVAVRLVAHGDSRLLVASAEGSPFAFFAWPAATPKAVKEGLDALLRAWSHRGVLEAAPALATLDPSGRLRARRGAAPARLHLPEASSAPAAALLALVIGAPCTLMAARAGAPLPNSADAFVARFLARRASIRSRPDRIDVVFGADDFDLALRRAGLDRDPGYLPWLKRSLRFVFEERDLAASLEVPVQGEEG